jgi:glycosyltransferase involved in cell wall biosynthesis
MTQINTTRSFSMQTRLGIDWPIGQNTGWGVYGLNLALHCLRRGGPLPVLCSPPDLRWTNSIQDYMLAPSAAFYEQLKEYVRRSPGSGLNLDFTMLRSLGNDLMGGNEIPINAKRNIGMIFFEDTKLTAAGLERARNLDLIVAGSTWNGEVLRGYGLENVAVSIQGIDPTIFHPAPRAGWLKDRFIVFSGGKLEYRKGQDIVVATFREFHRRHPDAMLMVAWHNYWPETMIEVPLRGHVQGIPEMKADGKPDIVGWLVRNGIPAEAVLDIGPTSNAQMGLMIREANVGLFTNRCEGGTNLVAMECMASGVPAIISANTGHLDLLESDSCYALREQGMCIPSGQFKGVDGWGESYVEEALSMLEQVYDNYQEALTKARKGSEWMHRFSWENQINHFINVVGDLLNLENPPHI